MKNLVFLLLISLISFGYSQEITPFINSKNKVGLQDENGKIILTAKYDNMSLFYDDVAIVVRKNKFGLIHRSGKKITSLSYQFIGEFGDDLAPFRKKEKYGYINPRGQEIIPAQYHLAYPFSEGIAVVVDENKKYALINVSGRELTPRIYDFIHQAQNGISICFILDNNIPKTGALNNRGEIVIPMNYDRIVTDEGGQLKAFKGEEVFYYTQQGELINTHKNSVELPGNSIPFPTVRVEDPKAIINAEQGDEAFDNEDYESALAHWKAAAMLGHVNCMYNVAVMYRNGMGTERDLNQALSWYTLAAEEGSSDAMCGIGTMYEVGEGFPQDYTEAEKWYLQGAELNNAVCMYNLGTLYGNGLGSNPGQETANYWLKRAEEFGFER